MTKKHAKLPSMLRINTYKWSAGVVDLWHYGSTLFMQLCMPFQIRPNILSDLISELMHCLLVY